MSVALAAPAAALNPPSRDDSVFATGRTATYVIGQSNFTGSGNSTTQSTLRLTLGSLVDVYPTRPREYRSDIAFDIDGSGYIRLWVADTGNNRILRFPVGAYIAVRSGSSPTGMNADLVLGQSDFSSMGAGSGLNQLNAPSGLAFDSNGYLWVSDTQNNRVLRYSSFSNGASADIVLGGSQGSAANQFWYPTDVAFNTSGHLFVADMNNHRVVRFSSLANGASADVVFGQLAFGTRYIYDPSLNCTIAPCIGSARNLHYPVGVAVDTSGYLWVADHESNRAMRFSSIATGASADFVIGQPNFTTDTPNATASCADDTICSHAADPTPTAANATFPHGVNIDGENKLWVADSMNNRVLRYDSVSNGVSAAAVLGQSGTGSRSSLATSNGFTHPTAAVHDPLGNLWVVDMANNRILAYETNAINSVTATSIQFKLGHNYNTGSPSYNCDLDTSLAFNTGNKKTTGFIVPGLTNQSVGSLISNTTYYLQCQASSPLTYRVLDSTITAVNPVTATPTFSGLSTTGVTVNWSQSNNASGTLFEVQLCSDAGMTVCDTQTTTSATSMAYSGKTPNHRYYARVRSYGWLPSLGTNGYSAYSPTGNVATYATLNSFAKVLPTPDPSAVQWVRKAALTYTGSTGDNYAKDYLYVLDNTAGHSFTGSESVWTAAANLTVTMSGSNTFYFHIAPRNLDNVVNPSLDLGPYLYDAAVPVVNAAAFTHFSSTGGALSTNGWNDQATMDLRLTAQDILYSGFNVDGYGVAAVNTAAYWHFDEQSGRTAADASANGNHGARSTAGTLNWTTGHLGGAVLFNGTNHSISVPDSPSLTPSGGFTIEVWVQPDDVESVRTIYSKDSGSEQQLLRFKDAASCGSANPCIGFGLAPGGVFAELQATVVTGQWYDGNWHHLVATYDGSTKKVFKDGALVASAAASGALSTSGAGNAAIGSNAGVSGFYAGGMDELRILNVGLTDAQVAEEYERGYGGVPFVLYSTDTGSSWRIATRQVGPNPYLGFVPPTHGGGSLVTVSGTGFDFVQSASLNTGAAATNQVRFVASDRGGNMTTSGPFAVLVETTPANAITTLAAANIAGSTRPTVGLTWNAKGGGGNYGLSLQAGSYYAIQFATYAAVGWSTASAQVVISTANVADGNAQSYAFTGLASSTLYYFKVWTRDWMGLWSAESNLASVVTGPVPPAPDTFFNGHAANLVVGQSNFTAGSPNQGGGIAASGISGTNAGPVLDASGNLWVSDIGNRRLLRYSAPFSNGMNANLVIGQANFNSGSCLGVSATALDCYPQALNFDLQGRLWVGDNDYHRVLRFSPPFANNMAADLVLGQTGFTGSTSGGGAAGLKNPQRGIVADANGNIWVGDAGNSRVLRFSPPFTNGMSASLVLGQSSFAGVSANRGGSPAADTLNGPQGMAVDASGALWVSDSANHRVLRYRPPFSNGMSADLVLGQAAFGTQGSGLSAAAFNSPGGTLEFDGSGGLWVADAGNNRMLRFEPPFSNGMNAAVVVGQGLFTQNAAATTQRGLNLPYGADFDINGDAWVTENNSNRTMRFPATGFPSVLATTITVRIGANGNDSVTSYQVDMSTDPAYPGPATQTSAYATSLSREMTGLVPNTTYYARAKARNTSLAESAYAAFGSTLTLANIPTIGSNPFPNTFLLLQFSWLANLNPAGTQYQAQLSTAPDFTGTLFDSGLTTNQNFTFIGLGPGTTYYAHVRARNSAGTYTAYTANVSTSVQIAPPPTFGGNPRVSLSSGSFVLNTSTTNMASPSVAVEIQSSIGLRIGAQPTILSSSTLALWHLDEGTGSTAYDDGAFHVDATLNTAGWAAGKFSNALNLSGTGSADAPYNANLDPTAFGRTIEAWVYPNNVTTDQSVFDHDTSVTSGFMLHLANNGAICATHYNVLSSCSGSGFVTAGTWNHVAWTWDPAGPNVLYVNGIAVHSFTMAAYNPSTANFRIGRRSDASYLFNGRIDELRLLNRPIGPDEVATDYYSGGLRYSNNGTGGPFTYVLNPASVTFNYSNLTTSLVTSTVTAPALVQGTNSYVRWLVSDLAGQTTVSPAYQIPVDTTPPAALTTLAATNVAGSSVAVVNLTWTGAGSDAGTLALLPGSYYAIQASTYTSGVVWSTANAQVMIATAVAAGVAQSARLYGLFPDRPTNLRVWTADNVLNWSAPSNIAVPGLGRTLANPPAAGANFYLNQRADAVLGQPDFTTTSGATSATKLTAPYGLGVDASGNLWVGEQGSAYRVVRYPPPHSNGMAATAVLGQANLTDTGSATAQNRLSHTQSVCFDTAGNAYVVDWGNRRLLRFEPPFSNGMNASVVIGQIGGFTASANVVTQKSLVSPRDCAFDSTGSLWVADQQGHRVLQYRPPFDNGMAASLVLGQANFTSNSPATTQSGMSSPHGVAFDATGNLWVAEYGNYRVLRFSPPFSNGMNANLVLGQADFTSGSPNRGGTAGPQTMHFAGRLAFDGDGQLWVTDHGNHRLLRFTPPFSNGMNASLVLGQPDFTAIASNQGGAAGANTFFFPLSSQPDALGAVWVADSANQRVLRHMPQALTVTGPNSLQAALGADGNPDTTQYEVQVSSLADFSNSVPPSSGFSTLLTSNFSGLLPNSIYYGRSRAKNNDGLNTAYTHNGSTRTQAAQPLSLAVTLASNTLVSISWNANQNPAFTVYEASLSTDVFTLHVATQVPFGNGLTATATTHSNLAFGTSYYFRVRARNQDLVNGAFSAVSSTETVPDRPTGLAGVVLGVSSIAWTWSSAGGNATRYRVRTTTPIGQAQILASGIDLATTTFVETGLKPNIPYGVQVEAFDNSGSGGLTATVTHYTFAAQPISMGRIAVSSWTIGVAWNANQNPSSTRYEISYSTDNFSLHAATPIPFSLFNISTASLRNLEAGTSYYIRIRAENDEPPGSGGPVVTAFTTLLTQTIPGPVPIVNGSVLGISSIAWTWNSTGGGATLYRVYDGYTGALLSNNLVATNHLQTGLSPNVNYAVQVEAYSNSGSAGLSPPTTHFTHAVAPANLAATLISTGSVSMRWSAANPGYTRYELSYSTDPAAPFTTAFSTPIPFTAAFTQVATTVPDLVPGPTYWFRVRAENNEDIYLSTSGAVRTAFSNTLKVLLPPVDIGNLNVTTLGTSSLMWTWSGSTSPGVNYNIYTATEGVLVQGQSDTFYTRTGLNPNSLFGIRVQADVSGQVSPLSDVVTGYTFAAVPAALTVTGVSSGSVALSWSDNGNPGFTVYELAQSLDGFSADFSTPVPAGAGQTATSAGIAGLAAGVTYYYKVRAFNSAGVATLFGAIASTDTLPAPAAGLAGTVLGSSSITWTWNSSGGTDADLGRPVNYRLRRAATGATVVQDLAPPLLEAVGGTLALWRLNENAGATAADASGAGRNLTLSGAAWTAGRQGYALTFDGSTAYADTPDAPAFDLGDYTLEAWVRVSTDSHAGSRRIVGQGNAWALNLHDDRIEVCDSRDLGGCVEKGTPINDLQWHHFAVTRRNGSEYRYYVDGSLVGSEPAGTAAAHSSADPVRVGHNPVAGQYFDGMLDEIRILSRALSDEEVAADGAGKLPYTETGLTPDTAYGVTLSAYDGSGQAAGLTPEATRYTLANPPTSLTVVSVTSRTVSLSWSQAGNPGTTPYELTQSDDGFASQVTVVASFAAGLTAGATVVSGLEPGTLLSYRVRARNGESIVTAYSNVVSALTLPGAPTGLVGTALGTSSVAWSWAAAPGSGNLYRIYTTTGASGAPATNRVGFWPLDAGSGTTAADASPTGNTGTLVNSPQWTTGKSAGALLFDGVNSHVRIPNHSSLNPAQYTIHAWVNPATAAGGNIVAKTNGPTGAYCMEYSFALSSLKLNLTMQQNGCCSGNATGATSLVPGDWTFVSATYDGSALKVYVNGQLDGTGTWANGTHTSQPLDFFIGYSIGPGEVDCIGAAFDGKIDEVQFIAQAQSAAEVAQAYASYQNSEIVSGLGSTSFLQTGLSTNTLTSIAVEAYNATGVGTLLGPATRYTLAAAPGPLQFTAASTQTLSVTWDTAGNPSGTPYEISLSTDAFLTAVSTPVSFASGLTAAATVLADLDIGSVYHVRARARNAEDIPTDFSAAASTLTLPGAPSGLQGNVQGTGSIVWSWDAAAGRVAAYRVRNATAPADILLDTPATGYVQLGLRPNRTYGVTVESYNGSGSGGTIGPLSKFTFAARPADLVVNPVSQLNLVGVTSTTVSLAWQPGDNPTGTPYELSQSTDGFSVDFSTPVAFAAFTGTATLVAPLLPGTEYSYRVRARNDDNMDTDFSNVVTTRTLAVPGAVTDLTGTQGFEPGVIALTWTSPGDNGTLGSIAGGAYRIDYTTDLAHAFSFDTFVVEFPTSTPQGRPQGYTLTGLLPGASYRAAIFTRSGQGQWSAASNIMNQTAKGQTVAFVVNSGSVLDFGTAPMALPTVGENFTGFQNVGNSPLTFVLSGSTNSAGTPWVLVPSTSAAPGENLASMFGAFSESRPGAADFDAYANLISSAPVPASALAYTVPGGASGGGIPPALVPGAAQSRRLWYRLDMPLYTTTAAQQSFKVTIIATTP